MLRFLTENGRNRSNSRQLSEILFFVKLKQQKERKTKYWIQNVKNGENYSPTSMFLGNYVYT
jgi:hypothetical protein